MPLVRALLLLVLVAAAACADLTAAAPPRVLHPAGRTSTLLADPATDWPAAITVANAWIVMPDPSAQFPANAYVHANMRFDAYHARITAHAYLRDGTGSMDRLFNAAETFTGWLSGFHDNYFEAEWPILIMRKCGSALEADVGFEAWVQSLAGANLFRVSEALERRQPQAVQQACAPCPAGGPTAVNDPAYDPGGPYEGSNGASDVCPASDSGGNSGASGIQFSPGDNTGGETVDWATGVGDGGQSACGAAAVVEYVCLDYFDFARNEWVSYDCGYATTC